jgi:hypothetical protein
MKTFRTAALVASAVFAATSLRAQATLTKVDSRWQPFLGCWETAAAGSRGPMVCLLPTNAKQRIELLTVSEDSIFSRTFVTATGARVPITRDGCTGWESASWSSDDRRLFTRAEFRCGSGASQAATGIYSMTDGENFSRIEGVKTASAERTRVVNFGVVRSVRMPPEIASRLPNLNGLPISVARMEAAATLTTADVVEASKAVESGVVEAWLGDRMQPFTIAARDLRALRDAGVTPGVIDMVVAVSHPKAFAIASARGPGSGNPDFAMRNRDALGSAERMAYERELRLLRMQSGFGLGWGDTMFPFDGMNRFNGGGFFSPFFGGAFNGWNGFGSPYWYDGGFPNQFNNGFFGGGGFLGGGQFIGGGPFVIVPSRPTETDPGRVVRGSGYSQTRDSNGGGEARPTPSGSTGGNSNGVGSNSSTSSGGSANSGGSTGGGQRTAKPRP